MSTRLTILGERHGAASKCGILRSRLVSEMLTYCLDLYKHSRYGLLKAVHLVDKGGVGDPHALDCFSGLVY